MPAPESTAQDGVPGWDVRPGGTVSPGDDPAAAVVDTLDLDLYIQSLMSTYHIPGVSACMVKDGAIVWSGAYGYANFEQSIPVSDSTLFMLASVSKTFTGLAMLQLWEAGLADLDENINVYMPIDVVNPNHPGSPITIRSLLAHTSSLNDNWSVMYSTYVPGDTPFQLADYVREYFLPGGMYYDAAVNFNTWMPESRWEYCNHGFVLLGYLVQSVSGMPFPQYCRDSIFAPLGMDETSWFLAGLDTDRVAMPYTYSGGTYVPYGHFGYADYPAGTLRSSAPQLARHLMAHINRGELGGKRIMDSATVEAITTLQYPSLSGSQGLTWFRNNIGGRIVWQHGGGDRGVRTRIGFSPDLRAGVVVLTNGESETGVNQIVTRLWAEVAMINETAREDGPGDRPRSFRLFQNHPNPFNPSTQITYSLPEAAPVTLRVFDVLGREITTLLEQRKEAGIHTMEWNAGHLPGGIYFFRLRAGGFTETRKMVLMR